MIDLRCPNRLHGRWNPVTGQLQVKCQQCSKQAGKDVYHDFALENIVIVPIEPKPEPVFVCWRVVTAEAA